MAKLYFYYASMNAGKSTNLLQADFNYRERGMRTVLFTAAIDDRFAAGTVTSRIGLGADAIAFERDTDLVAIVHREGEAVPACVLVDEAQFLTAGQVDQLATLADVHGIPVLAYGLRTDFQGQLFEGSARLLAIADSLVEIKSVCHCGRKATMNVRLDASGAPVAEGRQTEIGGNDRYVAMCRKHFSEALGAGDRPPMHGWIILDKPLGLGSTQGVSAVKRALRQGGYPKAKVGHGGTLDPLATGVLPIAVGEATKLAGRMLDSDKVYEFTVAFGVQTDTLDLEGKEIAWSDVRPTLAEVEAVVPRFTGAIEQVPPAYSALKVDGQRAYDLARAGEEVVLASRSVTIHSLNSSPTGGGGPFASSGKWWRGSPAGSALLATPPPPAEEAGGPPPPLGEELEEITLTAHVSKGTYIRTLARDIAIALGTVGHVTMLRRTKAGPFDVGHAISLDKLAEFANARALEDVTLPLRAALDDIPALPLTPEQAGALRQGRVLVGIAADDGPYFALLADTPIALVEVAHGNVRVERGFNL